MLPLRKEHLRKFKCEPESNMTKLGIISDTHDRLYRGVFDAFAAVDLILHAGDIISEDVLSRLKKISPVEAVYGNCDLYSLASRLPAQRILSLEGLNLLLIHNIGNPNDFSCWVKRGEFKPEPNLVVFGHTHRPLFEQKDGYLFVNPGCAGMAWRGHPPTVLLLEIADRRIVRHRFVELAAGC